jgi:hypothetical protein
MLSAGDIYVNGIKKSTLYTFHSDKPHYKSDFFLLFFNQREVIFF